MYEIIVDNFAGGGGASTGIEMALGRSVDIAINHSEDAIRMHRVNHPTAKHYCENVWEVDPREAAAGRPVGLCWFSPDCKHFSKAKGGKPVEKKIRGLAWVAVRWAATVKPRVIILENVEEFKTWGPLTVEGKPDPKQKGRTFNSFVHALEKQGYKVDYKELRACDYGAPTIRKRFFLIARCDGRSIVWPEPTHGDPSSEAVKLGKLLPWRTAAEVIDWSLPCPSIFDRKRPLAENTMKRIAKGIQKFVINNADPFVVRVNYSGSNHHYTDSINEPLKTVTAKNGWGLVTPVITQIGQTGFCENRSHQLETPLSTIVTKQEHCLITPTIVVNEFNNAGSSPEKPLHTILTGNHHYLAAPILTQYHSEQGKEVRAQEINKPLLTVDGSNRYSLVSAFISKYYAGNYQGAGADLNEPTPTITTKDHNAIVTAFISQQYKNSVGHEANNPLNSITAVNKAGLVEAFLLKYYGTDIGQSANEPLHTVTTRDRFGLVTIKGEDYQIIDIGMRMLEPHELFAAQGFPSDYIIDRDFEGKKYPKSAQVARCGNAVPPPFAKALVEANLPELCHLKIRREA